MTLTELRYLVALAREKHFGRAAKQCHVSQPTLSMAVQKLEDELDTQLFERKTGVLGITPIGEKVIAQAQRTLVEADNIKELVASNKDQLSSPLRIGAIYTIAPYLYPTLIPALQMLAPDMPLIVEEGFTTELQRKLTAGELDIIIVALPFSPPNIVCKKLYDEPLVALLRKDNPLSEKAQLSGRDLEAETMLLLGEGHCFRDAVIHACPHCLESDKESVSMQSASLETLRHMVASGMGVTILPTTATQVKFYSDILCVRPFAEPAPHREVGMAWRESFPLGDVVDVVIKAVSTLCRPEQLMR